MNFDLFVGIDYSGAETADSPLRGLQLFAAVTGQEPTVVRNPSAQGHLGNWSRKGVAEWLLAQIDSGQRLMVGIDHGFSFPKSYLDRNGLRSWPQFLDQFCERWATDGARYRGDAPGNGHWGDGEGRRYAPHVGNSEELRLCERWTSGAKSVFQFDAQGSTAMSTHAGIPWLRFLREFASERIHIWPFDGWMVPNGRSIIAEVYSPLFRKRYPRGARTADEQDAYAVARWSEETVGNGVLERYLMPPLTPHEQQVASLEGWMLGVG